jgi:hypothetical protein
VRVIQQPDERGTAAPGRAATTLDAQVPAALAADAASLDARNRLHAKIVDISQCDAFDTLPFTFVAEAEMPTCGNLSPPLTMQQLCGFARKLKSIKVFHNAQFKLLERGSINGDDSLDHADLSLPEKYNIVVIDRAGWVEHAVPQNWDVYCPTQAGLDAGDVIVALWAHSTSLIMDDTRK